MLKLFFAIVFGAGLMYIFDPNRGSERRQALSDKFRAGRDSREDILQAGKDTVAETKDRAQAVTANARDRLGQTVEHARESARETVADVIKQTRGGAESVHERADSVFASDNKRS